MVQDVQGDQVNGRSGGAGHAQDTIADQVRHDYSTSREGIVPLDARRKMSYFAGLWVSYSTGFSFLFLGFTFSAAGYTLAKTLFVTVVGYAIYAVYAVFGSYLGARTGQTHGLLTRSVFGRVGSSLVSIFVFVAPLGWVGFNSGLLAQIWNGLYGWPIESLTIIVSAVMIANNLFGFTGITVFARYLVTPILVLWIVYLVIRVCIADPHVLSTTPSGSGLSTWAAIGTVIGFAMWGNEPDVWRYGQPKPLWSAPTYALSMVFFALFVAGGWMMAVLSHSDEFGAQIRYISHYSLFGAFWLVWIVAAINQFAANDGNYYESINAGQNLVGGWPRWNRVYTCLIVAAGGALAAWIVNYKFEDGFFKVADFLAITVPCATVIMAVDHFVLPRLTRMTRSLEEIPSWAQAGMVNVPALAALVIAVLFGAWGSGLLPNISADTYWGPVPLEAWALAGILYVVGALLTERLSGRLATTVLGFSELSKARLISSEASREVTAPTQ
jgi:purine-cytosine permease-like protein